MYEELVKNLRENVKDGCRSCVETAPIILQAADAIEYMNGHAKVLEKLADYWCERVPKWIPVTERLPVVDAAPRAARKRGRVMPFYSKDGFACSCNKNECNECNKKYVVYTNADRIRSMSDAELADELLEWYAAFSAVEWTKDMILDWLRKEAADKDDGA